VRCGGAWGGAHARTHLCESVLICASSQSGSRLPQLILYSNTCDVCACVCVCVCVCVCACRSGSACGVCYSCLCTPWVCVSCSLPVYKYPSLSQPFSSSPGVLALSP